ncbi:Ground domain-containing protein, partial [Trichostrongylus colubriformis]
VLFHADDVVSNNSSASGQGQVQQYSFPPNNTPITKVYIFGRPVYVRQPFVLPLRDDPYNPVVDTPPARETFPVSPTGNVMGSIEESIVKEELMKPMFANPMRYRLPERLFEKQPAQEPVYVQPKPRYPLPQCYTNDSGFMCCNRRLERAMRDVMEELTADKDWQTCNVQKIANTLQNRTQSIFNTEFEALAGLGDFASKTHFYHDLICKIEFQGRFMLSYATPNRHHPPPG